MSYAYILKADANTVQPLTQLFWKPHGSVTTAKVLCFSLPFARTRPVWLGGVAETDRSCFLECATRGQLLKQCKAQDVCLVIFTVSCSNSPDPLVEL